jgi:hypothetical protein
VIRYQAATNSKADHSVLHSSLLRIRLIATLISIDVLVATYLAINNGFIKSVPHVIDMSANHNVPTFDEWFLAFFWTYAVLPLNIYLGWMPLHRHHNRISPAAAASPKVQLIGSPNTLLSPGSPASPVSPLLSRSPTNTTGIHPSLHAYPSNAHTGTHAITATIVVASTTTATGGAVSPSLVPTIAQMVAATSI